MKRLLLSLGLGLIALTALPQATHAETLYRTILEDARRELSMDAKGNAAPEPEILEAIPYWLPHIKNPEEVTTEELDNLLMGGTDLCDREDLNVHTDCVDVREAAVALIAREESIRTQARMMQTIASSFEEPVIGGENGALLSQVFSIARLWTADIGPTGAKSAATGPSDAIEWKTVTEDEGLTTSINELAGTLPNEHDALTAAVWKYRFGGARWWKGERTDVRKPSADDRTEQAGTERELLTKSWPDVEQALESIATTLMQNEETDVAVNRGQTRMFSFPKELTSSLPENVRVWAFVRRLPNGSLTGDAGLVFAVASEPVQLTLCGEAEGGGCDAIGGGHYPPAPRKRGENEGSAFCAHPIAEQGLLCTVENVTDETCAETPEDSDTIQLTVCNADVPEKTMPIGGDACADVAWAKDGESACDPGQSTEYRNTIGNAVCFLNRCWKESFTEHRMIPGRTPLGPGDNAYPFDSCMKPDPQLGRIVPGPSPEVTWTLPPYRPAWLLQRIEELVCPGMPLGSPLCFFDVNRRLNLPLTEGQRMFSDIENQANEFAAPGLQLRELSVAIGMRVGTRLYGDFLKAELRSLTDFAQAARSLLLQFPKVDFPTVLCPLNDAGGDLCAALAQQAALSSSSSTR